MCCTCGIKYVGFKNYLNKNLKINFVFLFNDTLNTFLLMAILALERIYLKSPMWLVDRTQSQTCHMSSGGLTL